LTIFSKNSRLHPVIFLKDACHGGEVKPLKRKAWLLIVLAVFALCFLSRFGTDEGWTRTLTHTVQKGDTLWDICEKYYGDPDLWPKLWEMNPFVTNPHLLSPGDVITLLKDVPLKKTASAEEAVKPATEKAEVAAKPEPVLNGVDVSGVANVKALGALSLKPVAAWGSVFSNEDEKLMVAEGDVVYVEMNPGFDCRPGDAFTAFAASELLEHPLTQEDLGYVLSYLGTLRILEHVKDRLYKAKVLEAYRTIRVNDYIIPYKEPPSSCVRLRSASRSAATPIAAVKEGQQIIGQYTVVYLAEGKDQGIERGNLFEIIKKRSVTAPGSTWYSRGKTTPLPDVILGHVLILEVLANTAAGVVLATKEDVRVGTYLKPLQWTERPAVASMLPPCRTD
jgi:hypothetical protein